MKKIKRSGMGIETIAISDTNMGLLEGSYIIVYLNPYILF